MYKPAYFDTVENHTHVDTVTFRCKGKIAESAFIAVIRGLGLPLALRTEPLSIYPSYIESRKMLVLY